MTIRDAYHVLSDMRGCVMCHVLSDMDHVSCDVRGCCISLPMMFLASQPARRSRRDTAAGLGLVGEGEASPALLEVMIALVALVLAPMLAPAVVIALAAALTLVAVTLAVLLLALTIALALAVVPLIALVVFTRKLSVTGTGSNLSDGRTNGTAATVDSTPFSPPGV